MNKTCFNDVMGLSIIYIHEVHNSDNKYWIEKLFCCIVLDDNEWLDFCGDMSDYSENIWYITCLCYIFCQRTSCWLQIFPRKTCKNYSSSMSRSTNTRRKDDAQ